MSNTEEDINELKSIINLRTESGFAYSQKNTLKLQKSIRNILAERKQDKARIKELEEINKKYIVQLTDEQYRKLVDNIRKEIKQEFEQKVKDKIKEIKEDKESKYFDRFLMTRDIDYAIEILEELLEDK